MNWRRIISLIGACLGLLPLKGQLLVPTYSRDIHPILQAHCSPCHSKGGIAPFALTTFEDAHQRASMIAHVTQAGIMPPWPADTGYRHFSNENILSVEEKEALQNWASQGAPEGKASQSANPTTRRATPRNPKGSIKLVPSHPNYIPPTLEDQFIFQLLPDTLAKDVFLEGFIFRPGNRRVVHHVELLALRPEDWPKGLDSLQTETEYFSETLNQRFQGKLEYIAGWLPGNQGEQYPKGIAKPLKAGTRFVMMVHYGPSPEPEWDNTTVELLLAQRKPKRIMESFDFHGSENLPNRKWHLPADTIITFHAMREVMEPLSVFAIYPHAHHLATQMRVTAILPAGDTLPLLHIPQWQFDWQFRYDFESYMLLPEGSQIHFWVTYDNTAQNPENPYFPPREIPNSFDAQDEMMELFLWSVPTLPADRKKKPQIRPFEE